MKMPILHNSTTPLLALPKNLKSPFFICFISSTDPTTQHSWCPDVRAALPHVTAAFAANGEREVVLVEVGQRPEYVYC